MSRMLLAAALLLAMTPARAADAPADQSVQSRLDALTQEVEALKAGSVPSKPDWITFGGDLRVRHDVLRGKIPSYTQFLGTFTGAVPNTQAVGAETVKNDSVLTNLFGLDMHVRPAEGVTLTARLLTYKVWGMEDQGATQAGFFADRQNAVFDGTVGHVPSGANVYLDRAYATIKDIFDKPIWFSAGRRPSTGGAPTNVRDWRDVSGSAGTPGLFVNYAFDGATIGAAPEIEKLPGFAAKLCFGRGFDSGYSQQGHPNTKDTNFFGVNVLALETANTRIEGQYQRAFDLMDAIPGPNVRTNLGDVEDEGGTVLTTFRDLPGGDLTVFGSGAVSVAHPNQNRYNAGFGPANPGLLCSGDDCGQRTGWAFYTGLRYDLAKTRTKLGAEYNRGSKYWLSFTPAADDLWTSKLGTRGSVYELYAIQDLGRAPISRDAKVFFRLGWQYYAFQHTGSNSWIGEPQAIKDLTPAQMQFMPPVKSAYDIYTSFDVRF